MRSFARTAVVLCILGCGANAALGMEAQHFEGTWLGERNGIEVVWQFDAEGHLRSDGRRASWVAHSDSLLVEFEPPSPDASSEKAVYRFVGSDPSLGHRRLFIYGFDLGQSGILLTRKVSDEDLARLQSAVKVGTGAGATTRDLETPAAVRSERTSSAPQR